LRFSRWVRNATGVLEFAAGTLARSRTEIGDRIEMKESLNMASSSTKGAANRKSISDILINRKLATDNQLQPAVEEARVRQTPSAGYRR